jgi:hypothetical protein
MLASARQALQPGRLPARSIRNSATVGSTISAEKAAASAAAPVSACVSSAARAATLAAARQGARLLDLGVFRRVHVPPPWTGPHLRGRWRQPAASGGAARYVQTVRDQLSRTVSGRTVSRFGRLGALFAPPVGIAFHASRAASSEHSSSARHSARMSFAAMRSPACSARCNL